MPDLRNSSLLSFHIPDHRTFNLYYTLPFGFFLCVLPEKTAFSAKKFFSKNGEKGVDKEFRALYNTAHVKATASLSKGSEPPFFLYKPYFHSEGKGVFRVKYARKDALYLLKRKEVLRDGNSSRLFWQHGL